MNYNNSFVLLSPNYGFFVTDTLEASKRHFLRIQPNLGFTEFLEYDSLSEAETILYECFWGKPMFQNLEVNEEHIILLDNSLFVNHEKILIPMASTKRKACSQISKAHGINRYWEYCLFNDSLEDGKRLEIYLCVFEKLGGVTYFEVVIQEIGSAGNIRFAKCIGDMQKFIVQGVSPDTELEMFISSNRISIVSTDVNRSFQR